MTIHDGFVVRDISATPYDHLVRSRTSVVLTVQPAGQPEKCDFVIVVEHRSDPWPPSDPRTPTGRWLLRRVKRKTTVPQTGGCLEILETVPAYDDDYVFAMTALVARLGVGQLVAGQQTIETVRASERLQRKPDERLLGPGELPEEADKRTRAKPPATPAPTVMPSDGTIVVIGSRLSWWKRLLRAIGLDFDPPHTP